MNNRTSIFQEAFDEALVKYNHSLENISLEFPQRHLDVLSLGSKNLKESLTNGYYMLLKLDNNDKLYPQMYRWSFLLSIYFLKNGLSFIDCGIICKEMLLGRLTSLIKKVHYSTIYKEMILLENGDKCGFENYIRNDLLTAMQMLSIITFNNQPLDEEYISQALIEFTPPEFYEALINGGDSNEERNIKKLFDEVLKVVPELNIILTIIQFKASVY